MRCLWTALWMWRTVSCCGNKRYIVRLRQAMGQVETFAKLHGYSCVYFVDAKKTNIMLIKHYFTT